MTKVGVKRVYFNAICSYFAVVKFLKEPLSSMNINIFIFKSMIKKKKKKCSQHEFFILLNRIN